MKFQLYVDVAYHAAINGPMYMKSLTRWVDLEFVPQIGHRFYSGTTDDEQAVMGTTACLTVKSITTMLIPPYRTVVFMESINRNKEQDYVRIFNYLMSHGWEVNAS